LFEIDEMQRRPRLGADQQVLGLCTAEQSGDRLGIAGFRFRQRVQTNMFAALSGLIAGMGHVWSGADHLAAIAPLHALYLRDVLLPGGVRADLALDRLPSPWSPDAVLSIDGALAPFDPSWLEGVSFWRGSLAGEPGSRVFLSLSPRSSLGWIRSERLPGGIAYLLPEDIDPAESGGADARLVLAEQLASTGKDLPPAYCAGSLLAPDGMAGAPASPQPGFSPSPLAPAPAAAALPPSTGAYTAGSVRLAIETDYQYFQRFGNLSDANAYATQMIAAISAT